VTFRLSIQKKFAFSVTALVIVLVGAILLVIEKREVNSIVDEYTNRGLLFARTMAELNLRSLQFWDVDALQSSINEQIDDNRLYIVFFDRYGTPIAHNRQIESSPTLYSRSQLRGDETPTNAYIQAKDVYLDKRVRRILEIEIPIFLKDADTAKESNLKWGSLKLGLSLAGLPAEIRKTRLVLILIAAVGLFFGILGATVLARRITRPIKDLAEGTVRIARGDFAHTIAIDSEDEIGHLARSFNVMSGKLRQTLNEIEETHKRLIQSEKLAQIGRMAATIAHEIRNPLTSVKLNIQKIQASPHIDAVEHEHLALSEEGIGQIERFIKELLNFTRVSDLQKARFSIDQVLDESLKLLRDVLAQKKITIDKRYAADLPEIVVDGDRLRQVFANVLRNASEAVEPGGRISITTGRLGGAEGGLLRIRVSDNGCGIPEKDWDTIFEPFFTTKPQGFGLGLANARKIVEQHNGTIRVARKRGSGTAFEILLPYEGEL
jgi:signal transduction histidine kinase